LGEADQGLRKIFLVHGEIDPMKALAESLTDAGARLMRDARPQRETKVLEYKRNPRTGRPL
jgi:hypothetical protein